MKQLSDVIGFDYHNGEFTVGTHPFKGSKAPMNVADVKANKLEAATSSSGANYSASDVDALLATMATGGASAREDHTMLAAQMVEPIMQVVPYIETYTPFAFMDVHYGDLEDNAIPVEDLPVLAFESHQDGSVMYTRAGYYFTRPNYNTWATGIRVPWKMLKKAGWNFLSRQMNYATWALARKRDAAAKAVLDAAILPAYQYTVTGGLLTKTAVDTVLKAKATIGFPVRRILVNSGTIMGMASFTWPTGLYLPDAEAREIIKNLYIGNYGGAEFYINPFVPTNTVYFASNPNEIGWHQVMGEMTQASDVDITTQLDEHAIYDADHAWYVGNAYGLASLTINP